ncbi:hypothetical protein DQG23_16280, partial [Paenibacillus contaminans]
MNKGDSRRIDSSANKAKPEAGAAKRKRGASREVAVESETSAVKPEAGAKRKRGASREGVDESEANASKPEAGAAKRKRGASSEVAVESEAGASKSVAGAKRKRGASREGVGESEASASKPEAGAAKRKRGASREGVGESETSAVKPEAGAKRKRGASREGAGESEAGASKPDAGAKRKRGASREGVDESEANASKPEAGAAKRKRGASSEVAVESEAGASKPDAGAKRKRGASREGVGESEASASKPEAGAAKRKRGASREVAGESEASTVKPEAGAAKRKRGASREVAVESEASAAKPEAGAAKRKRGASREVAVESEASASKPEAGAKRKRGASREGVSESEASAVKPEAGAKRKRGASREGVDESEASASKPEAGAAKRKRGASREGVDESEANASKPEAGAKRKRGAAREGVGESEAGASKPEAGAAKRKRGASREVAVESEAGASKPEAGAAKRKRGASREGVGESEANASKPEAGAAKRKRGASREGVDESEASASKPEAGAAKRKRGASREGVDESEASASKPEAGAKRKRGARTMVQVKETKPPAVMATGGNRKFAERIMGKYGFYRNAFLGRLELVFRNSEEQGDGEGEFDTIWSSLEAQLKTLQSEQAGLLASKRFLLEQLGKMNGRGTGGTAKTVNSAAATIIKQVGPDKQAADNRDGTAKGSAVHSKRNQGAKTEAARKGREALPGTSSAARGNNRKLLSASKSGREGNFTTGRKGTSNEGEIVYDPNRSLDTRRSVASGQAQARDNATRRKIGMTPEWPDAQAETPSSLSTRDKLSVAQLIRKRSGGLEDGAVHPLPSASLSREDAAGDLLSSASKQTNSIDIPAVLKAKQPTTVQSDFGVILPHIFIHRKTNPAFQARNIPVDGEDDRPRSASPASPAANELVPETGRIRDRKPGTEARALRSQGPDQAFDNLFINAATGKNRTSQAFSGTGENSPIPAVMGLKAVQRRKAFLTSAVDGEEQTQPPVRASLWNVPSTWTAIRFQLRQERLQAKQGVQRDNHQVGEPSVQNASAVGRALPGNPANVSVRAISADDSSDVRTVPSSKSAAEQANDGLTVPATEEKHIPDGPTTANPPKDRFSRSAAAAKRFGVSSLDTMEEDVAPRQNAGESIGNDPLPNNTRQPFHTGKGITAGHRRPFLMDVAERSLFTVAGGFGGMSNPRLETVSWKKRPSGSFGEQTLLRPGNVEAIFRQSEKRRSGERNPELTTAETGSRGKFAAAQATRNSSADTTILSMQSNAFRSEPARRKRMNGLGTADLRSSQNQDTAAVVQNESFRRLQGDSASPAAVLRRNGIPLVQSREPMAEAELKTGQSLVLHEKKKQLGRQIGSPVPPMAQGAGIVARRAIRGEGGMFPSNSGGAETLLHARFDRNSGGASVTDVNRTSKAGIKQRPNESMIRLAPERDAGISSVFAPNSLTTRRHPFSAAEVDTPVRFKRSGDHASVSASFGILHRSSLALLRSSTAEAADGVEGELKPIQGKRAAGSGDKVKEPISGKRSLNVAGETDAEPFSFVSTVVKRERAISEIGKSSVPMQRLFSKAELRSDSSSEAFAPARGVPSSPALTDDSGIQARTVSRDMSAQSARAAGVSGAALQLRTDNAGHKAFPEVPPASSSNTASKREGSPASSSNRQPVGRQSMHDASRTEETIVSGRPVTDIGRGNGGTDGQRYLQTVQGLIPGKRLTRMGGANRLSSDMDAVHHDRAQVSNDSAQARLKSSSQSMPIILNARRKSSITSGMEIGNERERIAGNSDIAARTVPPGSPAAGRSSRPLSAAASPKSDPDSAAMEAVVGRAAGQAVQPMELRSTGRLSAAAVGRPQAAASAPAQRQGGESGGTSGAAAGVMPPSAGAAVQRSAPRVASAVAAAAQRRPAASAAAPAA